MNVTKNQIDDLNLELVLNVAAEDYAPIKKKKLNERRKTAEFKGFRKGMVPMSLVERVYGPNALVDAVNEIISEQLDKFIRENSLNIVGEPITGKNQKEVDWEDGKDFEFVFDMALNPEVKVEVTKDDEVNEYSITVTEKAKKEMKDNLSASKPCIALTANVISGARELYLKEGFTDYLSKPVDYAKLEALLVSYIDKSKIQRV